ncbi:MAG: RNA-binding protein [SAR202 cluster bacterium]|nr:RNA-binding protein [SAR202 cluster bacterium]
MRIFVGNLGWGVNNQALESLFAPFGEVEFATVLMDRDMGRSKGFGFVEMPVEAEARNAIAGLSGKEEGGRALTVNEARPREERTGGGGRGGFGGGRGRY